MNLKASLTQQTGRGQVPSLNDQVSMDIDESSDEKIIPAKQQQTRSIPSKQSWGVHKTKNVGKKIKMASEEEKKHACRSDEEDEEDPATACDEDIEMEDV